MATPGMRLSLCSFFQEARLDSLGDGDCSIGHGGVGVFELCELGQGPELLCALVSVCLSALICKVGLTNGDHLLPAGYQGGSRQAKQSIGTAGNKPRATAASPLSTHPGSI